MTGKGEFHAWIDEQVAESKTRMNLFDWMTEQMERSTNPERAARIRLLIVNDFLCEYMVKTWRENGRNHRKALETGLEVFTDLQFMVVDRYRIPS